MDEAIGKLAGVLAGGLLEFCRITGATPAEFEAMAGELRRAVHAATCAARVKFMTETERKGVAQ
jgi:hypothetical protein